MGYDIGNVMANLMFAWVNADATMSAGAERYVYGLVTIDNNRGN